MPQFIIDAYIISGIVMAVGAYFTIRYRPYCTLKSPEREIAMELHRKHLMDEPMDSEEITKNELYKKNTVLHLRWAGILIMTFWLHFFMLIVIIGIEPITVKVIGGLLIFGGGSWLDNWTD